MSIWVLTEFLMNKFRPKGKPVSDVVPVIPVKRFSYSVDSGYVDDLGRWHADKQSADYASARSCLMTILGIAQAGGISISAALREPDIIRAMAILSKSEEYDSIRAQFESECG